MRIKIVSAGLISVVIALATGCSSGGSDSLTLGKGSTQELVAKDSPNYHFEPDVIKVPVGQEVTFTFKNEGKVKHNFTISYLDISVDVQPGQSVPVKFTAPDKGTLMFYDNNGEYQGEGMIGKIEVE